MTGWTWPLAGGYADPPVASGAWKRANWLGAYYELKPGVWAYHTGDDMVRQGASCAFKPVYAIGAGKVIYAQDVSLTTWGNLVVIEHSPTLHSRYAHLDQLMVQPGDTVSAGQQIGTVGNAHGLFAYHLHFDISASGILRIWPRHWPGQDLAAVLANYEPPLEWLRGHMIDTKAAVAKLLTDLPDNTRVQIVFPDTPPNKEPYGEVTAYAMTAADARQICADPTPPPVEGDVLYVNVNANSTLSVRSLPSLSGQRLASLARGVQATVSKDSTSADGYTWVKLLQINGAALGYVGYVAKDLLSASRPT